MDTFDIVLINIISYMGGILLESVYSLNLRILY